MTRYRFLSNPRIIMGNRLALPSEMTPSIMACRTFMTELVEYIFGTMNAYAEHRCNPICQETVQIAIYKEGKVAKDLVSRSVYILKTALYLMWYFSSVKDLLMDFEELISAYARIETNNFKKEILAIGFCFKPCAKELILEKSIIYLD